MKIFYSILLIVLTWFYGFSSIEVDPSTVLVLLVIVLISLILFALRRETNSNLKGQFLKHSTIAIIGIVIVHFQYYIDYLIGNADFYNWRIWVNHSVVTKGITLSVMGVLSFFLGYISRKNKNIKTNDNKNKRFVSTTFLKYMAYVALVVYFLTINPAYLFGHYGSEQMGTTATFAILIYSLLVFAIIIQNSRNAVFLGEIPQNFKQYIHSQGWLFTFSVLFYLLSVMMSGDRGPLITFSIGYVSCYFLITKKKLRFASGATLIISGALFITLLGQARSLDKSLAFTDKISNSFNSESRFYENSFSPATQELASSVRALNTTINYIPSEHDYLYGRFQLNQVLNVIPFFSYFTPLIFKDNSYKFKGSASFITWINQGDFPVSGDGTTCIADFYFDFGLIGVVFGMFFFGYLMRYCEVVFYSSRLPSTFLQTLAFIYLINAIYIARASVLSHLKMVVWVYVILLINSHVINRRS